jgi:preprotein translocase subunit SecG
MEQILVVIFMLASIGMVAMILMQHGKGADAGAAFGSGASATVFGAQGSANFLSRTTAVLAAGWFVLALALAWYAMNRTEAPGLMESADQVAPAVETPPPVTDLPDVPEVPKAAPASDIPVPPPAASDAEEKSEASGQTEIEKSGAVVDTSASETQAAAESAAESAAGEAATAVESATDKAKPSSE